MSPKRSRLLTFMGALIVFVAFIVNDVLRHNLSRLTDSIEAAQTAYAVLEKTSLALVKLDGLEQEVVDIHDKILPANTLRIPGSRGPELGANWTALNAASLELENVAVLLKLLPHSQSRTKSYEELSHQLTSFQARQAQLVASSTEEAAISKLKSDTISLLTETRALEADVLNAAQKTRADKQQQHTTYTWVSYALYVLGWSLGLYGRLHGIDGVAE